MNTRTIEITVNPQGETTVQTKGFTGPSCKDASRLIEQALGDKSAEQLTAEYHQAAQNGQQVSQQG